MLVHDTLPKKNTHAVVKNKSFHQRDFPSPSKDAIAPRTATQPSPLKRHQRRTPNKNNNISSVQPSQSIQYPLWLKGFIFLNHGSSLLCYLSVAVALVLYGMTVYAPKQWTNKYNQLQHLQKQERQFTFTDEVLKDTLAESAQQAGSGFVNPEQSKPPIFLPKTNPQPITSQPLNPPEIKKVEPISPVAY